jgi:predicted Zn-dependent protease with MMP-like domain
MEPTRIWLVATAHEVIQGTIDSLPTDLQSHARSLPVVLDPRPGPAWLAVGWPSDLLGLFSGSPLGTLSDANPDIPPTILIFYENLWDFSEGDEEAYRDEVHVTYLHELGHFLGLEESDLEDRDLL